MTDMEKGVTETTAKTDEKIFVDDKIVRFIGIPFFGLVIPNATGLLTSEEITLSLRFSHYLYFIAVAWIIWEGNRYLLFRYYPVMVGSHSLFQKYILMIGLNIFYSAPTSLALLYFWKWLMSRNLVSADTIMITVAVIVICVIFVTNIYEKVLFTKHSDSEKFKIEQLERTKVQAEMEALKNQIDPHFFFNTLNSISYLVDHNPVKAQKFIENLADVYRYILSCKEKNLVLLQDEIAFLHSYSSLMQLRYENAFQLNLKVKEQDRSGFLIPPVSMMVAIENAVKHNEVSKNHPLVVNIEIADEMISISNIKSERKTARDSIKTGLKNLDERFLKTLGKPIGIWNQSELFILQLPVMKIEK
jgi:sensor histidine kinase YesM